MADLIRPSKGSRLLDSDFTINGDAEKVRVCRKPFRPFFKVNLYRKDAVRVILVFRKHPLNHIIILRCIRGEHKQTFLSLFVLRIQMDLGLCAKAYTLILWHVQIGIKGIRQCK